MSWLNPCRAPRRIYAQPFRYWKCTAALEDYYDSIAAAGAA
ncbi:MAG: hypothetical protein WDO70_10995 [Alphaproteobacteria bacterium]